MKQGCIQAVSYILDKNNVNLRDIWELDGVQVYLKNKNEDLHNYIESTVNGAKVVPTPNVEYSSQSLYKALEEAEFLLNSKGATSAYDRMHTALHGFFETGLY